MATDTGIPSPTTMTPCAVVGLVLAIVMFVVGILTALSKKFKCKKSDSSLPEARQPGKTPTPAGSA
ncbi:unnamed protein product [Lepidochelys kempii]